MVEQGKNSRAISVLIFINLKSGKYEEVCMDFIDGMPDQSWLCTRVGPDSAGGSDTKGSGLLSLYGTSRLLFGVDITRNTTDLQGGNIEALCEGQDMLSVYV